MKNSLKIVVLTGVLLASNFVLGMEEKELNFYSIEATKKKLDEKFVSLELKNDMTPEEYIKMDKKRLNEKAKFNAVPIDEEGWKKRRADFRANKIMETKLKEITSNEYKKMEDNVKERLEKNIVNNESKKSKEDENNKSDWVNFFNSDEYKKIKKNEKEEGNLNNKFGSVNFNNNQSKKSEENENLKKYIKNNKSESEESEEDEDLNNKFGSINFNSKESTKSEKNEENKFGSINLNSKEKEKKDNKLSKFNSGHFN